MAEAAFGRALRRDRRPVDATIGSVGLAATLTALGLLVVHAGRLTARLNVPQCLVTAPPAASALVIVGLGCALALLAAPELL